MFSIKKSLIFGSVGLVLGLQACTSPTATIHPTTWASPINAHYNFYQVSPCVFRSQHPTAQLIPMLQQHQIDLIINLRTTNTDLVLLKNNNIHLQNIPIHTWRMQREDLLKVMQALQQAQQQHQRVLIHCYHGSDRTGAAIAMYRIIFEHWSRQDALAEMKYGGYGFHPIWKNIEQLFTPENIQWIQQQLNPPL